MIQWIDTSVLDPLCPDHQRRKGAMEELIQLNTWAIIWLAGFTFPAGVAADPCLDTRRKAQFVQMHTYVGSMNCLN
jgi:hypothetical protein